METPRASITTSIPFLRFSGIPQIQVPQASALRLVPSAVRASMLGPSVTCMV